jgi:hypothetical protein
MGGIYGGKGDRIEGGRFSISCQDLIKRYNLKRGEHLEEKDNGWMLEMIWPGT